MSKKEELSKYGSKEGHYIDDILKECELTDLAYIFEDDGKIVNLYLGQKANPETSTTADKPIQVRMTSNTFFGNSEVHRLIELIGKNTSSEIIFEFSNLES